MSRQRIDAGPGDEDPTGAESTQTLASSTSQPSGEPSPSKLAADPLAALAAITHDLNTQTRPEDPQSRFERLETLHRLAGALTHDFNNMLGVVVGIMENLANELDRGTEEQKLAELGLQAAERGAELLNRILAISRHRPPPIDTIDCAALLDDTLRFVHHTVPKSVEILVSAPAEPLYCAADRAGLEAALLNLCINSGDAMLAGGTLTIDIRSLTVVADNASGLQLRPGPYAAFIVGDTGHGMSAATLARAMEPLFTTKQASGGTGLGLSSVHDFARAAGGAITLSSRKGGGTTATLYVPRAIIA